MNILGIETSCDETAAAVVKDGRHILSNVVVSQIDIHKAFGGVVPEVAARSHIEAILPVIDEAVRPIGWKNIDAIAVANQPGLIGSLLIGTLTARTLALTKNIPLYPVHHVESHVYANFIDNSTGHPGLDSGSLPKFPILSLIVSGGHTQIVLFRDHGDFTVLGSTRDDAVGEAFDKVAKILGLPYPGGPSISTAAKSGNPTKYRLPRAKLDTPYDFSFSGLKTALLRAVQAEVGKDYTFPSNALSELLSDAQRNDFSASFQNVAVQTLVEKMAKAYDEFKPATVVVAGGVAANQELRRQLSEALPVEIQYPPIELCTDNAAMVASLGYFKSKKIAPTDPRDVDVNPSVSMAQTNW